MDNSPEPKFCPNCDELFLITLAVAADRWIRPWQHGLARWIGWALMIWFVTYGLLAQRRVYAEKWLSSTWKFFVLYTSYAAVQIVALVITVTVSFFLANLSSSS